MTIKPTDLPEFGQTAGGIFVPNTKTLVPVPPPVDPNGPLETLETPDQLEARKDEFKAPPVVTEVDETNYDINTNLSKQFPNWVATDYFKEKLWSNHMALCMADIEIVEREILHLLILKSELPLMATLSDTQLLRKKSRYLRTLVDEKADLAEKLYQLNIKRVIEAGWARQVELSRLAEEKAAQKKVGFFKRFVKAWKNSQTVDN